MTTHLFEFVARPMLIRRALAEHQTWIEEKLGVPLSDAIIFDRVDKNLPQVGLEKVLALTDIVRTGTPEQRRLRTFVAEADVPPNYPPMLRLRHNAPKADSLAALLQQDDEQKFTRFEWVDCPISFRLHYYDLTLVAVNVAYMAGLPTQKEFVARILVARRDCASRVAELLKLLYRRSRTPRQCTLSGDRPLGS
ncbi:hypothetical protein H7849_23805 [Alloacidobacterium dinghuense]|uniref:Uncharacterized protein n=1 Tax=Alloacidobacterium dinghuense TaxID=2763107 RepID=A0A7G8BHI1_9BACT|nr:hypothetical protein [Alloacidobacterium dinghuense]QNI32001.1 hypothetical protein H7849_23805 [Alloacidobacterium dinghuense]